MTHSTFLDHMVLYSYEVLESTNDEIKKLANGGAGHGTVVWAQEQTKGRGRNGREWIGCPGNLYASLLVQPAGIPMEELSQLAFVAGIAAENAIAPMLPYDQGVQLKWPNDLIVDHAKLGGLLLESMTGDEQEAPDWVIIGLGVNIMAFPEALPFPATSLKDCGVDLVSAKIVLSRFLHSFSAWLEHWEQHGFAPVLEEWLKCAYKYGEAVTVHRGEEILAGNFADLDLDGALILENPDGTTQRIRYGDVV